MKDQPPCQCRYFPALRFQLPISPPWGAREIVTYSIAFRNTRSQQCPSQMFPFAGVILQKRTHPCHSLGLQLLLIVILPAQKKLLRAKADLSVSPRTYSRREWIYNSPLWTVVFWSEQQRGRSTEKENSSRTEATDVKSLGIEREKCSSCHKLETRVQGRERQVKGERGKLKVWEVGRGGKKPTQLTNTQQKVWQMN